MLLDDNPRGRQAIDVSSAFTGIALITVLLRLYTRFFLVRCAGVEDYMVTLAMVCVSLKKLLKRPADIYLDLLNWIDYLHWHSCASPSSVLQNIV